MIGKVFFILLFVFFTSNCWSQTKFEKQNVYLTVLNIGSGIRLNQSTAVPNDFLKDYRPFSLRGSGFVEIKDNFGLHLIVQGIGYSHDFIGINSPGFYVLEDEHYFDNYKVSVLAGISYKFNYWRFVVIPFVDIGFIPFAKSTNSKNVLQKEQNSNNIRNIAYKFDTNIKRFDYAVGSDLFFHFNKWWGLSASFQLDRFKATSYVQSLSSDYFYEDNIQHFGMDFHYLSVLWTLGVFFSF